jgi:hypothetical protein
MLDGDTFSFSGNLAVPPKKHVYIAASECMAVFETHDLDTDTSFIDMHLRQETKILVPTIYGDKNSHRE